MVIHKNFLGGNIEFQKREGNTIYLKNEIRDTTQDWFYWAFCVEDAEAGEFVFDLVDRYRVGYWGAAVSSDLKEWKWVDNCEGETFKYTFKGGETLYFAHHMLYHPDRFLNFAKENGIEVKELCKSNKGRSVPYVTVGEGDISIILTARHHACESTGTYVVEGLLEEIIKNPMPEATITYIPFVDYDGVVDGDQGKARGPHDHNRDYPHGELYNEIRAIAGYAQEHGCHYGYDFHSPWHKGGENDWAFFVRNSVEDFEKFELMAVIPFSRKISALRLYQLEITS